MTRHPRKPHHGCVSLIPTRSQIDSFNETSITLGMLMVHRLQSLHFQLNLIGLHARNSIPTHSMDRLLNPTIPSYLSCLLDYPLEYQRPVQWSRWRICETPTSMERSYDYQSLLSPSQTLSIITSPLQIQSIWFPQRTRRENPLSSSTSPQLLCYHRIQPTTLAQNSHYDDTERLQ